MCDVRRAAVAPASAGVVYPVAIGYENNAEATEPMAATITAHNPSEINDITINASPLLRRHVAWGADDRMSPNPAVSPGRRDRCARTRLRVFGQPNVIAASRTRPFRIALE